jgi:hypothetical protein
MRQIQGVGFVIGAPALSPPQPISDLAFLCLATRGKKKLELSRTVCEGFDTTTFYIFLT